jgi:thiamine pyrophosphokinase
MAGETIILANGKFPEHEIPLGYLKNAEKIICCDGAARSLYKYGIEPYAIVGDIDSLKEAEIRIFHERLYKDADQETNDLTKAVKWCLDRDLTGIIILGATGLREDHTIGNISLLADYAKLIKVKMITDTGEFLPLLNSAEIKFFR